MTKHFAAALAALLVSATSALAATPIISGTYLVTVHTFCQPTVTANFAPVGDDTFVDGLSSNDATSDAFMQEILSANFNPTKGKVTVTGFQDEGSNLLLQFTGSRSGVFGSPLSEQPSHGSNKYSNTAATLTVNGDTSNAFYGGIDAKGIAHSIIFMRLSNGEGDTTCSDQGEAIRQ
jgi:hypothetical protein